MRAMLEPEGRIPPDLVLGVSTSAHQIEGGDEHTDWWAFEESGRVRNGDVSGVAADFWNLYARDVALMRLHAVQSHRMSLSWGRIEPAEGKFDDDALERYAEIVAAHTAAGIRVGITLLHFALPQWLAAQGGMLAPEAPERFARFVRVVAQRLRSKIWHWYTINEPLVQADQGYRRGVWPPGTKRHLAVPRVLRALLRAHCCCPRSLRLVSP